MAKTPSKARRPTVLLPALLCLMSVAVRQGGAQDLAMPSTALLAASLNPPHVVRGDDGRDHVEYDLLVTNAFASPVTLAAVEITGPGGAERAGSDQARCAIGVSVTVGLTLFTRMPCGPSSIASTRVSASRPALDAQ